MSCEAEYAQQLPSSPKITTCLITELSDMLLCCCGTVAGTVVCFDLRHNVAIASVQVTYTLNEALQHTCHRNRCI